MEASVAKLKGGPHDAPDRPSTPELKLLTGVREQVREKTSSRSAYLPNDNDIRNGVCPRLIRSEELELVNDISALKALFPSRKRIKIRDKASSDLNATVEVSVFAVSSLNDGLFVEIIHNGKKEKISALAAISYNPYFRQKEENSVRLGSEHLINLDD